MCLQTVLKPPPKTKRRHADAAAGARDYAKLLPQLRELQTAVKRLEDAIAAVTCGPTGATRPGAFLFELLGGVGINNDTVFDVLHVLDAAVDLLDDETIGQMRRCARRFHHSHDGTLRPRFDVE